MEGLINLVYLSNVLLNTFYFTTNTYIYDNVQSFKHYNDDVAMLITNAIIGKMFTLLILGNTNM